MNLKRKRKLLRELKKWTCFKKWIIIFPLADLVEEEPLLETSMEKWSQQDIHMRMGIMREFQEEHDDQTLISTMMSLRESRQKFCKISWTKLPTLHDRWRKTFLWNLDLTTLIKMWDLHLTNTVFLSWMFLKKKLWIYQIKIINGHQIFLTVSLIYHSVSKE